MGLSGEDRARLVAFRKRAGKRKAAELAAEIGVAEESVRLWLDRDTEPDRLYAPSRVKLDAWLARDGSGPVTADYARGLLDAALSHNETVAGLIRQVRDEFVAHITAPSEAAGVTLRPAAPRPTSRGPLQRNGKGKES